MSSVQSAPSQKGTSQQIQMANAIRALAMDAVQAANSGHPGMPMGMADVATVLFNDFLKFDPTDAKWADRDRFILSAGHGSTLLYSLLYLTGYEDMTLDDLKAFRQLGAKTAGHPEYGHASGIEMTTGPLGQGIATAVGMALAERMHNARYGDDLVDHHTYVIAGDGCLMEGISHEAIDLAGHLGLSRLIVMFDDNSICIDGDTGLSTSMDQLARFAAAGWDVVRIDGHDPEQITAALTAAKASDKPSLIACKTVIGFGSPNKQGTAATHGAPLGDEEIKLTRAALGWEGGSFEVPDAILQDWRRAGARGRATRDAWEARLNAADGATRERFVKELAGDLGSALTEAVRKVKQGFSSDAPSLATRNSSKQALDAITAALPSVIGGSADLTGSVGTKTATYNPVNRDNYGGNYLHYGVREHGMGAAMNGLALHGGFVPYGGTFLVFADYSRPAIRMAALSGIRAIHVLTHDSIGLGEDGPTHQPVETVASLRAIPNNLVFRPADAVEVAEAWQCALEHAKGPSSMCLTRQNLPTVRTRHTDDNLVAKGAYVLTEPEGGRQVTLMATGSEVEIIVEAAKQLAGEGIRAAVVSMPCWELFADQPEAYRNAVLGTAPRIGVEAAIVQGWERWLGDNGSFIGMTGFGASGPAPELYKHFGITPEAVVEAARKCCG